MKIKVEELYKIIAKSLNVSSSKINSKVNDEDFEEWDSLGQLSIISSLDKKFKGKLKLDEISSATSVQSIIKFLKKKKCIK